MLPTILCVVVAGFICGLLLLHWLALAFFSIGLSIACALVSPWDWLLVPRWFGLLTVFQLAYLAGVLIKVVADDARSRKGSFPTGADEEPDGGKARGGGSPVATAHVARQGARAWRRSAKQWVLAVCQAIKAT
jgi:hypothetical protein